MVQGFFFNEMMVQIKYYKSNKLILNGVTVCTWLD